MEPTRIIIDELPKQQWYKEWILIIIALIALFTSISSLYWTRQQFEKNNRPFVWAINYGFLDTSKNTIIPIPFRLGCRVKNSPAKIIKMDVKIFLDKAILFTNTEKNYVRFPDDISEWGFTIGQKDFKRIMNRPNYEKNKLMRCVTIDYSSLDGGKIYHFSLKQSFVTAENQWKDIEVIAD